MENHIFVTPGKLEEQKGDIVINWSYHSFLYHHDLCLPLLRKAGPQPLSALDTFKLNIASGDFRAGDVLTTIPGRINFNLIVHGLIDTHDPVYNYFIWYNIMRTLETYKKKNVCRNIYLTIPDWTKIDLFISEFKKYRVIIPELDFHFIVQNNNEKNLLLKTFKNQNISFSKSFFEKIETFLLKTLSKKDK